VSAVRPLPDFTPFDIPLFDLPTGPESGGAANDRREQDLATVTFVVVDLETTGGPAADAGITEIGAVKVRGGEVLGEFSTLVRPEVPIPPFITALTGITDALVAEAPRRAAALAAFWEFAAGAVLVAHNAPYDIGFLRAAAHRDGQSWSAPTVLDTVTLARHLLVRGEVRNNRLETLAAHFRTPVLPCHRALDDARATVAVLHGLIERAGALGLSTLTDLRDLRGRVDPERRAKRRLAEGLPTGPGVYVFQDAQGAALYVGTASNIRSRVQSYFTASETRRRIAEMLTVAHSVHPIACATALEAHVREIRTIHDRAPRYNRRSRNPEAATWLMLQTGARTRLRTARGSSQSISLRECIGPFAGRADAHQAGLLLAEATGVTYSTFGDARACDPAAVVAVVDGDVRAAVAVAEAAMADLAAREEFEAARLWRERLRGLCRAVERVSLLRLLAATELIVAAEPVATGHGAAAWHIHVISHGRLVAAGVAPAGADPRAHADALVALREVAPPALDRTAALTEESLALARWLFSGRVRLVHSSAHLALPLHCGAAQVRALPPPELPADS
jgi:DNA polymerase-3 subunit epsilon